MCHIRFIFHTPSTKAHLPLHSVLVSVCLQGNHLGCLTVPVPTKKKGLAERALFVQGWAVAPAALGTDQEGVTHGAL